MLCRVGRRAERAFVFARLGSGPFRSGHRNDHRHEALRSDGNGRWRPDGDRRMGFRYPVTLSREARAEEPCLDDPRAGEAGDKLASDRHGTVRGGVAKARTVHPLTSSTAHASSPAISDKQRDPTDLGGELTCPRTRQRRSDPGSPCPRRAPDNRGGSSCCAPSFRGRAGSASARASASPQPGRRPRR